MHIHTCCNNSHLLFSVSFIAKVLERVVTYLLSPIPLTFSFKPLHLGFLYLLWCYATLLWLQWPSYCQIWWSVHRFHFSWPVIGQRVDTVDHSHLWGTLLDFLNPPSLGLKLLIHSWCWFFLMFQPPNTGVAQDSALKYSFLDIYWSQVERSSVGS